MSLAEHPTLARTPLDTLSAQLRGQLITAASEEYDAARSTMYSTERLPSAVAKVADATDVAAVITFARSFGYDVSIRSGGHSLAHHSVIDDPGAGMSAAMRLSFHKRAASAASASGSPCTSCTRGLPLKCEIQSTRSSWPACAEKPPRVWICAATANRWPNIRTFFAPSTSARRACPSPRP